MSFNTATYGVIPESINVSIRRFSEFISVEIAFKANTYDSHVFSGEYAFIIDRKSGVDFHDALVTLRATFPNHTYRDCR